MLNKILFKKTLHNCQQIRIFDKLSFNAVQTSRNSILSFFIGYSNSGSLVSIASLQKRIFYQRPLFKRACHTDPQEFKNQKMVAFGHAFISFDVLDFCFCTAVFSSKRFKSKYQ